MTSVWKGDLIDDTILVGASRRDRSHPAGAAPGRGGATAEHRRCRADDHRGRGCHYIGPRAAQSSFLLLRKVLVGICPSDVAIAVHTGRVFVFNYDTHRTISMLDARSGALLSIVDPPGTKLLAFLPNASADDSTPRLVVVSQDPVTRHPSVTILDAASGQVRGIISLAEGQTPLAVDTRHNRLVVGTVKGAVSVLDAMSGHLVRRIRLGTLPVAAAVDALRRRIILVEKARERVTNHWC